MLAADLDRLSSNFTQPTQAVPLGMMAAAAAAASAGAWTPASNHPRAELSQAIPMPLSPNTGGGNGAVPPVRAQTTRYDGGGVPMPVPTQHVAPALRKAYAGPVRSEMAVVNTRQRRGSFGGLLLAVTLLALLGLAGFGIWRAMGQFTIVGTSDASPTPSAVAAA